METMVTGPTVVAESADRLVLSRTPSRWCGLPISMFVFLVVFAIAWDWFSLVLLYQWFWGGGPRGFGWGVVWLFITAIGAVSSLLVLDSLFVRQAWVIGPGCIACRTRVPLLRLVWEERYAGVQRIELRRGVWRACRGARPGPSSGRGHTDLLRFWAHGRSRPIELNDVDYEPKFFTSVGLEPAQ